MDPHNLIGRDDTIATMRREINKGRNVLLTGSAGVGKSALLQASHAALQDAGDVRTIYVAESSPNKDMLIEIARQLHERYQALPYHELTLSKAATEDAEDPSALDWSRLHKPVLRLNVKALAELVLQPLREEPYVIYLDHLDRVTPTQSAVLQAMLEHATVIGATCEKKGSAQMRRMWWAFKPTVCLFFSPRCVT